MTVDFGNYGIFLITGNAGFISSTVDPVGFVGPLKRISARDLYRRPWFSEAPIVWQTH